ncbi:MAG TPA: pitrilysin family protein [Verrucomicrobiae bacterium]|jgi:zinc protease|nr:pitrilysin family protein [Verrucomicrobiae bacterium]
MRALLFSLFSVFLFMSPARAQSFAVKETTLDNGLKVLLLEDHKSAAVTFQVWYRVGARNEVDGKSGLSHFLEHMMFKGTPTVKPEEYSRIIAKNGGNSNAFTSQDYTVYFATMSRDKIGIEVALEADRMANAILDGPTFENEKSVVMEERRLRTDDNPAAALGEVASAVMYMVYPYRRPVIGWMSDILHLTRDDLIQHYKTYYAPNNAFIVAVGDFSTDDMLAKIKQEFGKVARRSDPPKVTFDEPPQDGERRVTLKKEAELPLLAGYYHTPNLLAKDAFALDLLSTILAGGRSSRLHHDLVYEKQIATGIDADYDGLAIGPSAFSITAQVMPDKDPKQVEQAIDAAVAKIKSEPVNERELQKAKNQVEASFVFGQDSIFGQAMRIGQFESLSKWQMIDDYLPGIRAVTAADVQRVAKKYLDADKRTVGLLVPTKENGQ